jgi:1-acyl-sn-glycerol-3-phosphate acyltransferase
VSAPSHHAHAESWLSIWGRRAITIPTYLGAAALYLGALPLLLPLAAVVDVATGRRSTLPRLRALTVFAIYFACEVFGILGALALGLVTLGGTLVEARRYLGWNAALQRWWTDALFFGSVRVFGIRVETEGLEVARRGPMLLFVRHTSTADTVLTAAIVANPHRLLLRYVLKRELLWDPCLDLVGRRLPNAFVARGAGRRPQDATGGEATSSPEIDAVASLASGLDEGSAVLIYPEGTRFSKTKLARAIERLRARGDDTHAELSARLRHVLPPKLGGPLALVSAAPEVDVVVVEHSGFEGAATLASFWKGALVGKTLRVRLRRFPASTLPRAALASWLYERWAEVDAWVEGLAATEGDAPPVAEALAVRRAR